MATRPGSKRGEGGITLTLRIQPRASRNGMERLADGTVKVRLTAPPVDGAANEALVAFLAQTFSVGRQQVEILSGHTSRQKIVRVSGISQADADGLLSRRQE